jgi:hypothetical protein
LIGTATSSPFTINWSNVAAGSYTLVAKATDNGGAASSSTAVKVTVQAQPPPPPSPGEIVLYANDISIMSGWSKVQDASAAAGIKLATTDLGWSTTDVPLASPTRYFEVTFQAAAATRYRLWLRLRATADSKYNDSVWVQFSASVDGSGSPVYRIGTTTALNVNLENCYQCGVNGWGWQNRAYWTTDTGEVWFESSGAQTIRVQVREDGVTLDQIVLSPRTYLNAAPGPVTNDATIVPK